MKNIQREKVRSRRMRARRTRAGLVITAERPRLSVFRSLKHIRAQIIGADGKVLAAVSDTGKGTATEKAHNLGKAIAEKAKAKKIARVVFDKSHYTYHGRIQAFAEGAREGGLEF